MGQNHSDLAHLPAVHFNPEYELLQRVQDPHYGDVKYVRDTKAESTMILKQLFFNHKKEFEHEANHLGKIMKENHHHVVNILGYNFEDDHGFCSTHYKISLFIEHIDHNLQKEIENRQNYRRTFSETEVIHIAEGLISALAYFQNKGISHGDVRPFNIFILNQKYKLSDPALNAQKGSNALTQAILTQTKTFLAPELLAQVPKHRLDITTNPVKADVFSLGITLLSLATLTDGEALYDYHKGTIKTILLGQRLDAVRHLYSEPTYQLIRSMLEMDHNKRPDFLALVNKPAALEKTPAAAAHNEKTKKSVLVADYHAPLKTGVQRLDAHNVDTPIHDELEAKVRAALDRSRRTLTSFDIQMDSTTVERERSMAHGAPKEEWEKMSGLPAGDYQSMQQQQQQQPYYGFSTSYNNYVTPTYTPAATTPTAKTNYNFTNYPQSSYTVEQPSGSTRTVEIDNTENPVKTNPYEYKHTHSYNPTPITTAHPPVVTHANTVYPQYTSYGARTEQPVRSTPTKDVAQVRTTEHKPQQFFPEYQRVESYYVNPSPTYQPNQSSDKYQVLGGLANERDQPRKEVQENRPENQGYYTTNAAPNTYTTSYDYPKFGYQQTPAVSDLGFFQRAAEGTNAAGLVDYLGAR